jgi:hypothetical protein
MIQSEAQAQQVKDNLARVQANIETVKAARWRLLRNRRLLDENWQLLRENRLVLS